MKAVWHRALTDFNADEFFDDFTLPCFTNAGGCGKPGGVMWVNRNLNPVMRLFSNGPLFKPGKYAVSGHQRNALALVRRAHPVAKVV